MRPSGIHISLTRRHLVRSRFTLRSILKSIELLCWHCPCPSGINFCYPGTLSCMQRSPKHDLIWCFFPFTDAAGHHYLFFDLSVDVNCNRRLLSRYVPHHKFRSTDSLTSSLIGCFLHHLWCDWLFVYQFYVFRLFTAKIILFTSLWLVSSCIISNMIGSWHLVNVKLIFSNFALFVRSSRHQFCLTPPLIGQP